MCVSFPRFIIVATVIGNVAGVAQVLLHGIKTAETLFHLSLQSLNKKG
jgi:hypothetical protein